MDRGEGTISYTLKLVIDDSKIRELETRLGKTFGAEKQQGVLASIFGQSGEAGKNLAKLGGIAAGVTAGTTILSQILKISTESSGHFAATAKLWDTSIRMIFRPIGDTIGLVLRPFALMMIKWAVPFYQKFSQQIPEILEGGEKIAEGDVFGGSANVGGGILDTIFGEGAGDNWRSNQQALSDLGQGIIDFFSNISSSGSIMRKAYADTGSDIDNYNNKIMEQGDIFAQAADFIINSAVELHKRLSSGQNAGVIGGGAGAGRSSRSGRSTSTPKLMPRNIYEKFIQTRGEDFTERFMESRGFTGVESPRSTARNPRSGSMGITVNINNPKLDDPNLGRKIQDEVQKELKKLPGRR
ncbi:hypothetical protein [Nitrosopumilus sp.]|uniref:hypothetical protein n=1 Tax=Nitrosopumilus sp. TaxID=2024843 RepID=UPI003D09A520